MDSPTAPIPHSVAEYIYFALVAILASGGTYLFPKLKRKQTSADIHKTEADTGKAEAETRSIDLATTMHAGDMLLRFMERVAELNVKAEQLQAKVEFWQAKAITAEEAQKAEAAARELAEQELDRQHIRIGKNPPDGRE